MVKWEVKIMSKKVRAFQVNNLSKVKTSLYRDGDIFFTKRSIGILSNNKIKTIGNQDLSEYVKGNEVDSMINAIIASFGFITREEVEQMISDLSNGGEDIEEV